MSLSLDLSKFADKAGKNAVFVVRKTIVNMVDKISMRTPVDSGRLAANWQTTFDAPATTKLDGKGASISLSNAKLKMSSWSSGTVYITNNLEYANRIEFDGWSKKVPSGMARVTVREFQTIVNQSVAGVV